MDALLVEAEKLVDEADATSRKERVEAAAHRLKHVKEQEKRDAERTRLKVAADAREKAMRETRSPVVTIEAPGLLVVKIQTAHPDPTIVLQAKNGVRVVVDYFSWLFQQQVQEVRGNKTVDVAKTRKQHRLRLEDDLRYLLRSGLVTIEDSSK